MSDLRTTDGDQYKIKEIIRNAKPVKRKIQKDRFSNMDWTKFNPYIK